MRDIRLKCKHCGGLKFIGDPYYAHSKYYVDVTCVICSDSKDIEVEKLNNFLNGLRRGKRVEKQTDNE